MAKRRSNQGYSVTKRGKRCQSRFKDHHGTWRWVAAFGDYDASMTLARKLRQLSEYRAAGQPPDATLAKWIDGLADDMLDKLIEWEIIDAPAGRVSMADHIRDWHASILADGTKLATADQAKLYVERMVEKLQVGQVADIDREQVKLWLAGLKCKIETRNHHLRAIKQFCRWMIEADRATRSPVGKIRQWTITDKRERRALSDQDFQRLITATENAPEAFGLTGPQRATLYWLAAETGFRANEVRSLTAASFKLDTLPPMVTVKASCTKNGRMDTLALSDGLAMRMRQHFETKLPTMPAFTITTRCAEMIRSDLELAGIPAVDDAGGHFDFHALRVQCASNLARNGVSVPVAMARLRHSDPKLTMNVYTKLGYGDQTQALQALPKIKVG